ncbi:unnamed protein product [Rhizoctonia solani]|uniref:Uncharacterized protein n=3 Tax=Rhizoctonia solani TaxID=456999 RepID=A0A8H2ZZ42_9AGAM|nr:unnamed protein product [Rhizoctonia solani]
MDAFETYPPLPPSPTTPCVPLQSERRPCIRTTFSSGYIGSQQHTTISDTPSLVSSPCTPSIRRHSQSRGHMHSKSMNSKETPPPLPLPTEVSDTGYTSNNEYSDNRTEAVIRQWRMKRSQTDPGLFGGSMERREPLPSLPDNPRIWTPSQLAQYLLTALRFKSSEAVSLPKPVAQDIANFVVKCKLNGRVFLRLQERDIEEMGINQLWRTALMASSLELRKSLLKGRIWGFGFDNSSNELSTPEHGRRVPSIVLEREEIHPRESASPSCERLPLSRSRDFSPLRSTGYVSPSSSTLSFDSDAFNYTPSRRSTRPRAESTSSVASSSAGRVREIVRNLEQAANSSEDVIPGNEDAGFASGEMTSDSDEDHEPMQVGNDTMIGHGTAHSTRGEATPPQLSGPELNGVSTTGSVSTSYSSETSRASTSELIKTPPTSLMKLLVFAQSGGPPVPPEKDFSDLKTKEALAEEPNIKALLQEEGNPCEGRPRATSWGAKAWEEEFPGGTSRRVPATIEIPKASAKPLVNAEPSKEEMITVPRSIWDDLCRRLDNTERRIALLEMQEAKRRGQVELLAGGSFSDDHNDPKTQLPGGLSVVTLSPYLVVVGVGVCALVAEYVFGHVVGRRSRS